MKKIVTLNSGDDFEYDIYVNIYWNTENKDFAVESNLNEEQLEVILQQTIVEIKQNKATTKLSNPEVN